MNTLHRITTAVLIAAALLSGCAGTPAGAGATASPISRCVGQANADCYGGPP